jgi:hypothetical protein
MNTNTFTITSRSVLLRMKNVSGKSCTENQKHILCQLHSFLNLVVYEIMRNKTVTGQGTDDNMAHARCMLDT